MANPLMVVSQRHDRLNHGAHYNLAQQSTAEPSGCVSAPAMRCPGRSWSERTFPSWLDQLLPGHRIAGAMSGQELVRADVSVLACADFVPPFTTAPRDNWDSFR